MASPSKRQRNAKFYTVEEANAMLPLLRSILRDITELACSLRERQDRLARVRVPAGRDDAYSEELQHQVADFEHDQERLKEYFHELKKLKVELKDPFTGLIDFRAKRDGRDVFLCWKLGEPEITHWHELDSGFAGRQPLNT